MTESGQSALSVRERQLLKLAAAGLTDTAIAQRLRIGEATVSTYWRRIRTKIGPYSRTELVATLLRNECERIVSALMEENRRLIEKLRVEASHSSHDDFYRRLVEEAADAILIVGQDGHIQMLNESAADLFGWTQDELRGKHVSVLVPARHHVNHGQHIEAYTAAPAKKAMGDHMATPAVRKSGEEIPIAANLSAIGEGEDRVIVCVVRLIKLQ